MRVLKESFNAGEFTERLHSRYEIAKYKNACKTLTNFVPLPQGPVTRRPGTEYIAEVKTSAATTRLIGFEFSENDSYILEFGSLYIRFFHNGGQVQTVDADTVLLLHCDGRNQSVTITDEGATTHTVTASGNARLRTAQQRFGVSSAYFDGTGDFFSLSDHADFNFAGDAFTIDCWIRLADVTRAEAHGIAGQWDDNDNFWAFYYVGGSTDKLIFWAKNAGDTVIYIEADWTATQNVWYHVSVVRGWGSVANTFSLNIGGTSYATGSTEDGGTNTMPDLAGDVWVGKKYYVTVGEFHGFIDEVRISTAARWTANYSPPQYQYPYGDDSGVTYEIITTYATADIPYLQFVQSADVMYIVHENYPTRTLTRTAHASWAIANFVFTDAPAGWGAATYPRTVEFYEDRLCLGGTPDEPDTVWTSETGTYGTFTVGDASADKPITLTLGARKVNDIQWLSSGRKLLAGTTGEEWWMSGPTDSEPITPDSAVAKKDSAWGSERIMPVDIGDIVFYVQRGGKIIRELTYNYSEDKHVSTDLSILAEHLTRDYKIINIAYQQNPYQILWCIREDGTLISLTYMKEHDVVGWAKHTTAGGEFESVEVIPGSGEDEVWFIVKRTVDSAEVRYVEKLKPFNYGDDLDDAFYVDSGLSYDGYAATAMSGLSHLEGESVGILADGAVVTGKTVASGAITLTTAAEKVHIGLAYNSELETLDLVTSDQEGPLQGVIGRITNVYLRLVSSLGGLFGPSSSITDSIPYDDETTEFTGWTRDLSFDEGFDETKTAYIKCDEPLPFEVAAILFELED